MSKTRLLSILVIALIALNIVLIVVFVMKKPHQPPHHRNHVGPKNIIIEKLHFDEKQIGLYEELIQAHKNKINVKDNELSDAKNELYILLSKKNELEKSAVIEKMSVIQKEIEELHFNHFLDIKKLCNKEQLKYYNDLTHELAKLFSHPHRPKK